ncbi:MAG: chloride channel protein [Candidatus Hodarchaeota archaeon]
MHMIERVLIKHQVRLYILGAVIGVISGLVAVGFRWLILGFGILFVWVPQNIGIIGWLVIPVLGGLIVAFIVQNYAPEARGHGVPELMDAYTLRGGRIRMRVPLWKSLASAICIGSGGSCGREGPIAQIGGGIGSVLARKLNLNARMTKTLVVCGVASGIAASFNAPLGGTLFGIEVIAGGLIGFSIIPVILSSVVATALANAFLGNQPSFQAPIFSLNNYFELVLYLVLGFLLGITSVLWTRGFYGIEDLLERIKVSRYFLPAIGGLIVGGLAISAIIMEEAFSYVGIFRPDEPYFPANMGVGYAFMDAALIGSVSLVLLLAFGLLKAVSTSFTLGSGGSGGVFAPTLYIGTALGGAFGMLCSIILPSIVLQPMAFAIVGMAALFAGSGRAPITCIVMVMEMTNDYSMILPLMIAVSTSFLVASSIEEESIYSLKLSRRGVKLSRGFYIGALKEIKAETVMTKFPTTLSPDMTKEEVLKIIDDTQHTKFPVVDREGRIVGTLITEDLFSQVALEGTCPVEGLMNSDFMHVTADSSMDSILHAMLERGEGHAVVVDSTNPRKMIGFITKADVLRAYELSIVRLREEGEPIEAIDPLETTLEAIDGID